MRTNDVVCCEMPADVSPQGTWHFRGAYEDVLQVDLGAFAFPIGTNLLSRLWAHTWGTARPHLRNLTNELVAVGAPMSAVPGVSRFWTAQTTNDTFLLTWENFTVGRIPVSTNASSLIPDPSSLLSAQIELFRSGDFIARSNGVESVYRRINPDDWDDDGVENDLDEGPTVCDEDGFGPRQELPQGGTTNFYYWVDLVVSNANALVEFEGDGESDLPEPRFIARAGETNRVYLLVGKTYQAKCGMPLACIARESEEIRVSRGDSGLRFVWDVTLDYVPDPPILMVSPLLLASSACGGTHAVVQPERARGGQFGWRGNMCCYYHDADGSPVFACNGDCGCGGDCATGDVSYSYVGYTRTFSGWSCRCSGPGDEDDPEEGDGPDDEPTGPHVSTSFSKDAVIFEEAYTNMPGVVVPRQSTAVEVSYYVYGGTNGGTYAFTLQNGSRLEQLDGGTVPVTGHVAAAESRMITARYRGRLPSAFENDIEARARFVEDETGRELPVARAKMTAVRVKLTAVYDAPENHNPSRHVYGVGEKVTFEIGPMLSGLGLRVTKVDENDLVTVYDTFAGEIDVIDASSATYTCPATGTTPNVTVSYSGVEYSPSMSVVEPQFISTPSASGEGVFWPGQVTMGTLITVNYIGPMSVSFRGVKIFEVPCTNAISPSGYFATTNFNGNLVHDYNAGAGWIHQIATDNYWATDRAGRSEPYANWSEGRLEWKIPIGWARYLSDGDNAGRTDHCDYAELFNENSRPLLIGNREDAYKQVFTIDENGASAVEKFGYKLTRERMLPFGIVSSVGGVE